MELIIILAIVVVIVIVVVGDLQRPRPRRNRIDEALGQIEVQLKRRHDLIPNLVNAVKGYMGFEQEVLTGSPRRAPTPSPPAPRAPPSRPPPRTC